MHVVLNYIFLKVEFNLSTTQIDNIMKLPDENKQTIFKSYIAKTESTSFEEQADLYIRKIDSLADIFDRLKKEDSSCISYETVNDKLKHNEILEGLKNRSIDLINLENNIKVVDVLKLVLRTRPIRFDYLFIYLYSCIQLRAKLYVLALFLIF